MEGTGAMSEEGKKRDRFTVVITRDAYDLLTENARLLNSNRKAIASEAIINLFQDRMRLLYLKGGIALAFTAAGITIGVLIL